MKELYVKENVTRGKYAYNKSIEKVIISKDVEKIHSKAFEHCTNLKQVIFEEGSCLKLIGKNAFSRCSNLETVENIPKEIKINDYAFAYCYNLSIEELCANKIAHYAFYNSGLKDICIEISGKIYSSAFECCSSLENVSIFVNKNLTDFMISNNSFKDCWKLSSFKIYVDSLYDSYKSTSIIPLKICDYAFSNCKKLKEFSARFITYLAKGCFKGCSSLEKVVFYKTNSIEDNVFSGCSSLTEAHLNYQPLYLFANEDEKSRIFENWKNIIID